MYTFKQLYDKIEDYADILSQRHTYEVATRTVALLCTSGRTFLFCWLALIRNGLSDVLIAPEISDTVFAYLCKQINAFLILHDGKYQKLAQKDVNKMSQTKTDIIFRS